MRSAMFVYKTKNLLFKQNTSGEIMSRWKFDPVYDRVLPASNLHQMDFEVDKVDYSVSEFFESFGHNLPKVVIVTQGFFGEIVDDTFDKDQVYRLHAVSRQKRIIAKSLDRHFSIPLNYPLKVCVVKKHGKIGKEQTLKDIVTEHAFPVDIKFAKGQEFAVGSSTTSADRFPQLKLIDVFDEVYFLANTIIDGVLDLRVVKIPLYLSLLKLAEITGIKNQPQERWKRYNAELSDLVTQSVEFDLTFGNKDIAVYHDDAMKTDTVYTYIEPRTYSNIYSVNQFQPTSGPSKQLVSQKETSGNVYEEIQKTSKGSYDVTKPLHEMGGEMKSFFQEKKRASVSGIPAQSDPDKTTINKNRKGSITPELPKRNPTTKLSSAPGVPPKQNIYANDIPRGTIMPTPKPSQTKSPEPLSQVSPKQLQNKIPKAEEATSLQHDTSKDNKIVSSGMPKDDMEPSTADFNVAKLSMKELGDCMKKLRLSKYTGLFEEQMVDGAILKEMDTELLKSDFGLTSIEAIRLVKFAKEGHIPK